MKPLLKEDLDHVLTHTEPLWSAFRDARMFVTGGTGFFGKWFLETFAYADRRLSLGAKAVILTRRPARFSAEMPHLAQCACLEFMQGDIRDPLPIGKNEFDWIIHAAADYLGSAELEPFATLDSIISGTRRVLDAAQGSRCRGMLLTSSGAVYRKQFGEACIAEDFAPAPSTDDSSSTYAQAKRVAEHLCCLYRHERAVPVKIARCFAFVGPHLPLDAHFAVGNFLRDALAGGPIRVKGNGASVRSYLYMADFAIWIWTILTQGVAGRAYNVGSDRPIAVTELARHIGESFRTEVQTDDAAAFATEPTRYVPSVLRARELGLERRIELDSALERTARWLTQ